jgi:hypothetical protein
MGPAPRTDIDWEAIQREYRAGIMSIREIATTHNIAPSLICRRAKKFPKQWKRDLSKRVRVAVSRKIVNSTVNDDTVNAGDEDAIVEEAADKALEVIKRHRKSLALTAEIEARIFKELKDSDNPLMTVTSKSSSLHALVSAQEKRLKMERQAFGITDDSKPDGEQVTGVRLIFDGED